MSQSSKTRSAEHSPERLRSIRRDIMPIVGLAALIVVFGTAQPRFFSGNNFNTLLGQIAPILVVALGQTFMILMGSIDLSIPGIIFLSSLACVLCLSYGLHPFVAILAAFGVGLGVGFANGVLVTKLKIPSILATLGMLQVCTGIIVIVSGGRYKLTGSPLFQQITVGSFIGPIPNDIIWAITIWSVCMLLAYRSSFGRYIYAIGGGELVSQLSGIQVSRYKLATFMLCGVLAGLGGVLVTGRFGGSESGVDLSFMIDSIAAVTVAGTAVTGGVGGPERTLVGAVILGVIDNGMAITGIDSYTQMWIRGLLIVFCVAISIDRRKIPIMK